MMRVPETNGKSLEQIEKELVDLNGCRDSIVGVYFSLQMEKDGWIFCHGGGVLFAFNPVTPYTDQRKVDSKAVEYRSFPLMDNPWIHKEINDDVLTLKHRADTLTLDFKEWKRKP